MKIECDKLKPYHQFTHNTMTDILCSMFRIDNSGNNIDIFYTYPVRQGLIIYIQLSNFGIDKSKLDLFSIILKIADDQEGARGDTFKLQLDEYLRLGIKCNIEAHGEQIVGDRMKIFVKHVNGELSVNQNTVIVELQPGSPTDSPIDILKQKSLSFFGHKQSSVNVL